MWDFLRPIYDWILKRVGSRGLPRNINGTDPILVVPRLRRLTESYEPGVWHRLMSEVRPGDVVVDVGAYVGLYAVCAAKRVGVAGRVVAFEPDPANYTLLRAQVELNHVEDRVEVVQAAVTSLDGTVPFILGQGSESSITRAPNAGSFPVRSIRLDSFFSERRVDLLKVDVEGSEEFVLRGGAGLLGDSSRAPRAIFIEVHPYAWPALGVDTDSLLGFLAASHHSVVDLSGHAVATIQQYGEVVAFKNS